MSVVMSSILRSTVDCNSTGAVLAPDEDLRGQNVVLLQSTVLREMPNITTNVPDHTENVPVYNVRTYVHT